MTTDQMADLFEGCEQFSLRVGLILKEDKLDKQIDYNPDRIND